MINLSLGNALDFYDKWENPTVIVSDGPYALAGKGGFEGDLNSVEGIGEWYEPHIAKWAERSTPQTTLWFWGSELSWAETYSTLKKYDWIYRSSNIWDKGIAHAAGNTNTQTLRKFPIVTELCVHYVRKPKFSYNGQELSAQEWLRSEWKRTNLPFHKANEACGVKNAATRKYLTSDHLWYFPPSEVFQKLADYANTFGKEDGKPYFSLDGINIVKSSQWEQLRGKFHCPLKTTNVWPEPSVKGEERIKFNGKAVHPNQKPLKLMNQIIEASSDENDIIWEPFGGLCSASLAAHRLNRNAYACEINKEVYEHALLRTQA